jgi:hypothetical protein
MITWLQNFFLKHNKWLFGGLLIVIIVTFVLTIGPQSFFGSSGPQKREALNYYGYDLSSESDQRAMALTAEISAIFHPELQVRRNQIMDYAYLRVAALGIARQLGIPDPAEDQLREYVETFRIFQDPQSGRFSAENYQSMLDALQANGRYTRGAIGRTMREDYRIAQVRNALGGPAYTLPFEARIDFLDRETEYEVTLLEYPYEAFEPEIDPPTEALEQYYQENPSRYEIPETLSATALFFSAGAYLDEVPDPSAEDLQAWFTANQSRYQPEPPASGDDGESPPPEITLDDVRQTVLEDWRLEEAEGLAARKGEQFSVRLWQDAIPRESEAFDALLEEFSVETRDLPAYSRGSPPRTDRIPEELLESMWIYSSNPNRYFSDIARNDSGAVVLVADGVSEARLPGFGEVRDQVEDDFRAAEKRRLFAEKGEKLRESLEARLTDEAVETVASDLGLEVESLEPFNGASVPVELQGGRIWDQTRFLEEGAVSPMVILGDAGTFAYMAERNTPEIEPDSEEFRNFLANRNEAMNEALGWARLREITDESLNTLFGEGRMP